jgi:hypothetical protein
VNEDGESEVVGHVRATAGVSKGVVLVRTAGLSPAGKAETVSLAIREHESELSDAFRVVSPGMFRIRRRTCPHLPARRPGRDRRKSLPQRYLTMKICFEDNSV